MPLADARTDGGEGSAVNLAGSLTRAGREAIGRIA